MKRAALALLALAALLTAVILPSAYKAKERTLKSLAQGYFRSIDRGDWPARTGPCPSYSSSNLVQTCTLDYRNPRNPAVQFTLKNGKTHTLTRQDVLPQENP